MKATIGAKCVTFARKHAGRVFTLALDREHTSRVREMARQVFQHQPAQEISVVAVAWQTDSRYPGTRQRGVHQRLPDFLVTYRINQFILPILVTQFLEICQQRYRGRIQLLTFVFCQCAHNTDNLGR